MKWSVAVLLGAMQLAWVGVAQADAKFEHLAVRVEQNATDNDFEIVFEATGGDTGLSALKVTAPDGRIVIDFKSPGAKLGLRSFRLETPEPKSLSGLQADFPAGDYTFTASTVAGMGFSGIAKLSHKLPGLATAVRPRDGDQNVAVKGLQIQWQAPKDLAACNITIEHDLSGAKIVQATLPGGAVVFQVPEKLLALDTQYKVSIGTVSAEGNGAYVESTFKTAKK